MLNSCVALIKHRQSQMPLFGIQIFLSNAETGTIYSHQIYTFVYVTEVLKHRRNPDVEIVATHVMSASAKHITVNIGCKDITSIISRYFRTAGTWRGIFEPSTATFLSKRKRVWMDNTGQISQRHLVNHPQKSTIPKT